MSFWSKTWGATSTNVQNIFKFGGRIVEKFVAEPVAEIIDTVSTLTGVGLQAVKNSSNAIFDSIRSSDTLHKVATISQDVSHKIIDIVTGVIPSPFNIAGKSILTAHDIAKQALLLVPEAIVDAKIPILSSVSNAATSLIKGGTTMSKIVLDHFVMTSGEVNNLLSTTAHGSFNAALKLVKNPLDFKSLIYNQTCDTDSLFDILKVIANYEYNSIKTHLWHDALLLKTPVDTIHKILTEAAQDMGIASLTNPALDLVRNSWGFVVEDVISGLVVNPVLSVVGKATEAVFGPITDAGIVEHHYDNNLSTAKPTKVDALLSEKLSPLLDAIFKNDGTHAGKNTEHSYHNTKNPTFLDEVFNRVSNLVPEFTPPGSSLHANHAPATKSVTSNTEAYALYNTAPPSNEPVLFHALV